MSRERLPRDTSTAPPLGQIDASDWCSAEVDFQPLRGNSKGLLVPFVAYQSLYILSVFCTWSLKSANCCKDRQDHISSGSLVRDESDSSWVETDYQRTLQECSWRTVLSGSWDLIPGRETQMMRIHAEIVTMDSIEHCAILSHRECGGEGWEEIGLIR